MVYIHIYVCIHTYIHTYNICIHTYVHIFIYLFIYTHLFMGLLVYVFSYVYNAADPEPAGFPRRSPAGLRSHLCRLAKAKGEAQNAMLGLLGGSGTLNPKP